MPSADEQLREMLEKNTKSTTPKQDELKEKQKKWLEEINRQKTQPQEPLGHQSIIKKNYEDLFDKRNQ